MTDTVKVQMIDLPATGLRHSDKRAEVMAKQTRRTACWLKRRPPDGGDMSKFPMQPISLDDKGIIRFEENKIVRYLLDKGGLDLNHLCMLGEFKQRDWEQFYQLIGYSVSGYHELNEVSDASASAASEAARSALALQNDVAVGCRDMGCEIHCGVEDEP